MLLVWRMRQDVRLFETRAIVQSVLAAAEKSEQNDLQDAWKDYIEELFPWERGTKKRSDQAAIDYLKNEVARGPLKVTPLQSLAKPVSRMRVRHDKVKKGRRWRS